MSKIVRLLFRELRNPILCLIYVCLQRKLGRLSATLCNGGDIKNTHKLHSRYVCLAFVCSSTFVSEAGVENKGDIYDASPETHRAIKMLAVASGAASPIESL